MLSADTLWQMKALTTRLQHTLPAVLRSGLTAATTAATLQQGLKVCHKISIEIHTLALPFLLVEHCPNCQPPHSLHETTTQTRFQCFY